MSDDRPRFVVKWTRQPPALYMLLERIWEGERRVARAVWVLDPKGATGFLSPEDARGALMRANMGGLPGDYDVRPLAEEIPS